MIKVGDLVSLGDSYFGIVVENIYWQSYRIFWFRYDNSLRPHAKEDIYDAIAVQRWREDFLRNHAASGTM
jgi:hypothetical protein